MGLFEKAHEHEQQKIEDGYGPAYHRIYEIAFPKEMEIGVKAAMKSLGSDINSCSPQLLARFEKRSGCKDRLEIGDEFLIHISGPWNGPVRVTDYTPDRIHLITLEGHMESGEIIFEIRPRANEIVFRIESLARSRNAIVDFVYDKIPIAKLAQTEMWTGFSQQFAGKVFEHEAMKDAKLPEVHILTERQDEKSGQWQTI